MQPGQRISANLQLVRLMGQGGMGNVWVADHLALGTQVAVKLMSRNVASDPRFVERFRREASSAAQLKSPHVAQVFDHGISDDGEPYIVMELLEGEDLAKRIARSGPQPVGLVADIVGQTARALSRAHQLGIVHRDIKAENVFLADHDGEVLVKVLDFGIAKTTADTHLSVTRTGGTFGTPLYMSPEQLLSAKHVDFRADLWSLAVLAYHALTDCFPFMGETLGAVSVAVNAAEFTPPSELRPGLSPAVDAWFRRAFRREASERFNSAKAMAETLRSALAASSPVMTASTTPLGAVSNTMANLPTVDSGAGSVRGVSEGGGERTFSGATVPERTTEPRRRALMVAVAALGCGAAIGVALLRPWEAAPAAPMAEAAAEEQPCAPSPQVVVVPSAMPSAVPSAAAQAVAAATSVAATSAAATSAAAGAPSPATSPSATIAGGSVRVPAAKTAAAAGSIRPAVAAQPKKDDIGF